MKDITEHLKQAKLKAVKKAGSKFDINNEEECLEAVSKNGDSIKYIKNPSEAVKLAAVRGKGDSIEFIYNPSDEVIIEAVKQDKDAVAHIDIDQLSEETKDILVLLL